MHIGLQILEIMASFKSENKYKMALIPMLKKLYALLEVI